MIENKRSNTRPVKIPELLAPAGNLEKLKMAIHYGADAVYLGGEQLSLRAKAGNFTLENLEEGLQFSHERGAKVYVAANIFAHNQDFNTVEHYFTSIAEHDVDGIIISDPGILVFAKKIIPHIPIHLSTQANVTNKHSASFWFSQGVSRLNLARELSFKEIQEIREHVDGELEAFVHGAICISYSGRCMLSNYLTDRDANQGKCSHPCRFKYAVSEEKRPGQYFPVEEDERGTYIFNSKDLCLLPLLPQIVAMGVDSLKIEGRMKSIFYVGGVVRVYRAALDYLQNLPDSAWKTPDTVVIPEGLLDEIKNTGTRGITENFAYSAPSAKDMLFESSRVQQVVEPVGVIRSNSQLLVEVRNKVYIGEKIEYMGPGDEGIETVIEEIFTLQGERLKAANPGQQIVLKTNPELRKYRKNDMFRRMVG